MGKEVAFTVFRIQIVPGWDPRSIYLVPEGSSEGGFQKEILEWDTRSTQKLGLVFKSGQEPSFIYLEDVALEGSRGIEAQVDLSFKSSQEPRSTCLEKVAPEVVSRAVQFYPEIRTGLQVWV